MTNTHLQNRINRIAAAVKMIARKRGYNIRRMNKDDRLRLAKARGNIAFALYEKGKSEFDDIRCDIDLFEDYQNVPAILEAKIAA